MKNFKIMRFFSLALIITVFMVLYVHINIRTFKLGYEINKKHKAVNLLMDEQRRMVLELNKLESPVYLSQKLEKNKSEYVQVDINDICYASIRYKNYKKLYKNNTKKTRVIDNILDTITVKAEAKARR